MKTRVVGVLLSLCIIGFAVVSLVFVSKITEIGGAGYNWEYIPPMIMLVFGIGLLAWWIYRIAVTK